MLKRHSKPLEELGDDGAKVQFPASHDGLGAVTGSHPALEVIGSFWRSSCPTTEQSEWDAAHVVLQPQ